MSAGAVPGSRLYSRTEACRLLDVVDETIRRWVKERKLREIQVPAKKRFRCRYEEDELERVLVLKEKKVRLPVVVGE